MLARSVSRCMVGWLAGWRSALNSQVGLTATARAAVTGKAVNLIPGVVNQPQREKGAREGAHEYQ